MKLLPIEHGHLPVIVAHGDIEAYEAAMLSDVIRGQIENGRSRIVLEFSRCKVVSATIIGLLIWLQRLARSHGGEILLVAPPRLLRRCLRLLESDGLFRCAQDRDHAVALLTRGGGAASAGVTARLSPGPAPVAAMLAAPSNAA